MQKKALIINTTIFDEQTNDDDLLVAMKTLVGQYCFNCLGIQNIEYAYFCAVHCADEATRKKYMDRAHLPG
jgi:hypothetical protein